MARPLAPPEAGADANPEIQGIIGRENSDLIPKALTHGGQNYQLIINDLDCQWLKFIPFARIAGRTDLFFVYSSTSTTRSEIILHTPQTIRCINEADNRVIARKKSPWSFSTFLDPPSLILPTQFERSYVERVLSYDKLTEGDALRLYNYLAETDRLMPDEFWPVATLWLYDEMNHFSGFSRVYHHLFGYDASREERLAAEPSDFEQFGSILSDPFATLISLAYDEASTIAGYRHDMPIYQSVGRGMAAFVNRVAADEGWHFSKFVDLAVKYFPHRRGDVLSILKEAAGLDGRPYSRTFFLDHDPRVETQFNDALKKRATDLVLRAFDKRAAKHGQRDTVI